MSFQAPAPYYTQQQNVTSTFPGRVALGELNQSFSAHDIQSFAQKVKSYVPSEAFPLHQFKGGMYLPYDLNLVPSYERNVLFQSLADALQQSQFGNQLGQFQSAPFMQGTNPSMNPNMQGINPNMQGMNPNMQGINPNMQGMNPNMQGMNPNMQDMNPNMQGMNPNMQGMNPNMQGMNPNMQGMNPNMQGMNPNMQGMNPNMQGMNPNMQGMNPNMQDMNPGYGAGPTGFGAAPYSDVNASRGLYSDVNAPGAYSDVNAAPYSDINAAPGAYAAPGQADTNPEGSNVYGDYGSALNGELSRGRPAASGVDQSQIPQSRVSRGASLMPKSTTKSSAGQKKQAACC